ncbi:MAG: hypothetical protein GTO03_13155 [Planctomycetales bacterium]|nr:hypothetical protein [Planctomycetales bacterium]
MTQFSSSGGRIFSLPGGMLAAGVLCLGITGGMLFSRGGGEPPLTVLEIPVRAEGASYGEDGFVTGTARLEDDLDAFYFFDGLTGELKVLAINPRTRKFMAEFSRNVAEDFKLDKDVKNPHFMVVAGVADLVEKEGNLRWSDSVFYVVERNSGKAACYAAKFPSGLRSQDSIYRSSLVGLDTHSLRKVRVRD